MDLTRALQARPRRGPVPAEAPDELHVCPSCGSHLVLPLAWAPAAHGFWSLSRRCPECEWHGEDVHAQPVVDRYDEVLDDGTQQMLDDLELLTRANMEEQVELFTAALHSDLIVPEDF